MVKKEPQTCRACNGSGIQQQLCRTCRGQGCDFCSNGYVIVTCNTCNGARRV